MSTTFHDDDLSNYVQVAERMAQFWADHPNGRVIPTIVEHNLERGLVMVRSEVFDERTDPVPSAAGHASEFRDSSEVNWTSHIENCETSANGRALANRGYSIERGIASREEMQKVARHSEDRSQRSEVRGQAPDRRPPAPVYEWQAKNGKAILVLNADQPEPFEVDCPIHPGSKLKRRTNDNGSWLSHKEGDGYCSASFGRQPRPEGQAAELRERLAAHNSRNGGGHVN